MPSGTKLTTEEFIRKSTNKHGDKYLYNKSIYINAKTKITITCKDHGDFMQIPYSHYSGKGCVRCQAVLLRDAKLSNTEEFIAKAAVVHGSKYDYSEVNYQNAKSFVTIICRDHGSFQTKPNGHLRGAGCPSCAGLKRLTTEEFILRSKSIHGELYSYSKSKYVNSKTPVLVECSVHGYFNQLPHVHFGGHHCPSCKTSRGENEIRNLLNKLSISFVSQKKFAGCKNKSMLPFDFFLPDHNICIEYDGKQHSHVVDWRPIKDRMDLTVPVIAHNKIRINDEIKNQFCKDQEIKLIRIPYTEFNNINDIIIRSLSINQ